MAPKLFSKIQTTIILGLSWVCFLFSKIIPRNKKVWAFIGWHKSNNGDVFADNAKYLFLYTHQRADRGVKPMWISSDKKIVTRLKKHGFNSAYIYSIPGIYHALRAGYTIIDAYPKLENWKFFGTSKVIQLWHGVPIKLVGYQTSYSFKDKPPSKILTPNLRFRPHAILSTSKWNSFVNAEIFKEPIEKMWEEGYPRNDIIKGNLVGSNVDSAVISRLNKDRPILFYGPTFRPNKANYFDSLDIPALYKFLEKHNAILYMESHPKIQGLEVLNKKYQNRIILLKGGSDIYPSLRNVDIYIGDYSSLSLDYLFLNKPIIYYQYDFETYKKYPGVQNNFEKITPGFKTDNFYKLLDYIDYVLKGNDDFREEREKTFSLLFKYKDSNSSKRVFERILSDSI